MVLDIAVKLFWKSLKYTTLNLNKWTQDETGMKIDNRGANITNQTNTETNHIHHQQNTEYHNEYTIQQPATPGEFVEQLKQLKDLVNAEHKAGKLDEDDAEHVHKKLDKAIVASKSPGAGTVETVTKELGKVQKLVESGTKLYKSLEPLLATAATIFGGLGS